MLARKAFPGHDALYVGAHWAPEGRPDLDAIGGRFSTLRCSTRQKPTALRGDRFPPDLTEARA